MDDVAFTVDEIIEALYLGLLDRASDTVGASNIKKELCDDRRNLPNVLKGIISSVEFRSQNQSVEDSRMFDGQSQFGEIRLILKTLLNISSKHRIIVDVGARGKKRSNSYDLLRTFGWRGILIEANPNLINSINEEFAGTDYEIINIAISTKSGISEFYIGQNSDVSSLDKNAVLHWSEVKEVINIDTVRLSDLLISKEIPYDFEILSLDIEGEDSRVFNDFIENSPYRPKVIILEVNDNSTAAQSFDLNVSSICSESYRLLDKLGPNLVLLLR